MPWKDIGPMSERKRFLMCYLEGDLSMSTLCREFGISRKTGYKTVKRFFAGGFNNLEDRSRAPLNHPNAISGAVAEAVIEVRQRHPHWGPKKIKAWLEIHHQSLSWPAASTIGDILKRCGLTVPRRIKRKAIIYSDPFVGCEQSNSVWSADLKGWFKTGDIGVI